MKYSVIFLASLAACLGTANKQNQTAETTLASTCELVWEDNFDVAGLSDSTIWGYEEGYIRNNELQYYTKALPENARVEKGNLVIEAKQDNW